MISLYSMLTSVTAFVVAGIAASAAAEDLVPVIEGPIADYYFESVGSFDLVIPLQLQKIAKKSSSASFESVGTTNFKVKFNAWNPSSNQQETLTHDSDLQALAHKCDSQSEVASFHRRYHPDVPGQATGVSVQVEEHETDQFKGMIYSIRDFSRPDKNFILGAIRTDSDECFSVSLAVFRPEHFLSQAALIRGTKPILDKIWRNLQGLTTRINAPIQ